MGIVEAGAVARLNNAREAIGISGFLRILAVQRHQKSACTVVCTVPLVRKDEACRASTRGVVATGQEESVCIAFSHCSF